MIKHVKGGELNINELKDEQLVYIEFDFWDITQCESDEDYDIKIQELEEEYPDSVYKVDLNDETFIEIETGNKLYFYHNLIHKIYEYNS